MMATTIAVALSVVVIKLNYKSPETRPPRWVRYIILNCMSKLVGIGTSNRKYHKKSGNDCNKVYHSRKTSWRESLDEKNHHSNRSVSFSAPEDVEVELLNNTITNVMDNTHMDSTRSPSMRSRKVTLAEIEDIPPRNEWKEMADILDRFFFWLFLIGLIVPTASILGFVRLFKPKL